MYKERIGIIVTVYNVEEYLEECVESIVNQTYRNLEIILVDDGSSDASGKICDEYQKKDARVRVIHQKNKGPLTARYRGVIETNCEYVTFVDGDDFIDLNTYEIVANTLDKNVDIVAFGIIRYFSQKNKRKELSYISAGKYSKEEIEQFIIPNMIWNIDEKKYGLDPSLCTKVIKRTLLINNLENIKSLGIHYGEDIALIYPIIKKAKTVVILDKCFYYHRQRAAGALPSYIRDEQFLYKLYKLYSFLMGYFADQKECVKQIDYFYIYAVALRRHVYGDCSNNDRYLFPFWEVRKNSRIVLYGAGSVGQTYYNQLVRSKCYEISAWIDKNFEAYRKTGMKNVDSIDVLGSVEYDYIVISVLSSQMAENIKKDLIARGIPERKIIGGE